jgi:hypothetical protein
MSRPLALALALAIALCAGLADAGGPPEPVDAADGGVPPDPVGVSDTGVPPDPVGVSDTGVPPDPVGVSDTGVPPEPIDPAARLPAGDTASEHWDLAAHFESGHRVYARFLITNEGPGERTAVAFGHVLTPDGAAIPFRNGRRWGAWQLGDDGRRIAIGSSALSFGAERRRFEVDNDKRGIKVSFEVAADAPGLGAPPAPGGARLDLLNLASPASGSLWLAGMAQPRALVGRALLTHSWTPAEESKVAALRIDVATLESGNALFVSDIRAPDGAHWSWAATNSAGGPLVSHPDIRVERDIRVESRSTDQRGGPYPIPRSLELWGKGLSGSIFLEVPPVLVSDPLDALPSLLKMVYSFGGRPRHVWAAAAADVTLESRITGPPGRIHSAGIAAFFFADAKP